METQKYIAIVLILISLLFWGCEKVIDFDEKDSKPMLVVNCILTADSAVVVDLTRSVSVLEETYNYPPVKNATITFGDGAINISDFEYISGFDSILYYDNSMMPKYRILEKGYYYNSGMNVSAGKTYKLAISANNFDDIIAETEFPTPVPIEKIDTFRTVVHDQYADNYYYNAKIEFTDEASVDNYYRINIEVVTLNIIVDQATGQSNMYAYYNKQNVSSDDPVFGGNDEGEIFGGTNNTYALFNDALFNGNKYSIEFNYKTDYSMIDPGIDVPGNDYPSMSYYTYEIFKIELVSLSESYFNYLKTVGFQHNSENDPFSDPVLVYSNVNNGGGIFGAQSVSDKFIVNQNFTEEMLMLFPADDDAEMFNYLKSVSLNSARY